MVTSDARLEYMRQYNHEHREERIAYMRRYNLKRRKEHRAYCRAYYRTHQEELKRKSREWGKRQHAIDKYVVLAMYGGPICVCCGESEIAFLSIDHTKKDGAEHRRKIGKGGLYRWLKRNNYPNDLGLEVLCMNCQFGRIGGKCPHEN